MTWLQRSPHGAESPRRRRRTWRLTPARCPWLAVGVLALLLDGCAETPPGPRRRALPTTPVSVPQAPASALAAAAPASLGAAPSAPSATAAPSGAPALPPSVGLAPSAAPLPPADAVSFERPRLERVGVPGDKALQVVFAPAGVRRALIYLHGVCGNVPALLDFAGAVRRYATIIALLGDERCPERGGWRWASPIPHLERRVEAALRAVQRARSGELDLEQVIAFGYSQGASYALGLHRAEPGRFPWLILGGSPVHPSPEQLPEVSGVLMFGGEYEPHRRGMQTIEELLEAGRRARWLTLPKVGHGRFGNGAAVTLDDGVRWLLEPAQPP